MELTRSYIAKCYINSCFDKRSMRRDPKIIVICHCTDDPNKYEGISAKFILDKDIILLDESTIQKFEYHSTDEDVSIPNSDDLHINAKHSICYRHSENRYYNFEQDLNLIPTTNLVVIIDLSPLLVPYVFENITHYNRYSLGLCIRDITDKIYEIMGAHLDEEIALGKCDLFKIKRTTSEAKIVGGKTIMPDMSVNIDKIKKAADIEDIQFYHDGTINSYYNRETNISMTSTRTVTNDGRVITLNRTTSIIRNGNTIILDKENIVKDENEKSLLYFSSIYDRKFKIYYKDAKFTIRDKMEVYDFINGRIQYYTYDENNKKQHNELDDTVCEQYTKADVQSLSKEESVFIVQYSSGAKIVDSTRLYGPPSPGLRTSVKYIQYLFKNAANNTVNLINTTNIISQNDVEVVVDCDNDITVKSSLSDLGIKMTIGKSIKRSQRHLVKENDIETTFIDDTLLGSSWHNKKESHYSFSALVPYENRKYERNIFGIPYLSEDYCKELG